MDLSQIPVFKAMAKRLAWLTERQTVLAQNVANVDTPGYVPEDMKEPDFRRVLQEGGTGKLRMSTTASGHFSGSQGSGSGTANSSKEKGGERSLSGNAVSLEDQMLKVSQTASDYALMTNLYRKQVGMVKTALGHSSS